MRGCVVLLQALLLIVLGALRLAGYGSYPENQWIGWLQFGGGVIGVGVVALLWRV